MAPIVPVDAGDASLLASSTGWRVLLDRSDLTELEVEVGCTGPVLRKPSALAPPPGRGRAGSRRRAAPA